MCQAEDGIRDIVRSRGLGDVYKRQVAQSVGIKVCVAGAVVVSLGCMATTAVSVACWVLCRSMVAPGMPSGAAGALVELLHPVTKRLPSPITASMNIRVRSTLRNMGLHPVSYTHLTLPPSDLV